MRKFHLFPGTVDAAGERVCNPVVVGTRSSEVMCKPNRFITPLYRRASGKRPEQGATATWLAVGRFRFVVTAAHSVDEGYVWFPMQKGLRLLPENYWVSSPPNEDRKLDRADVALFPLRPVEIENKHPAVEFISLDQVDVNLNHKMGDRFEFTGYPWRREKIDPITLDSIPQWMAIIDQIAALNEYTALGCSPLGHIVCRFNRRHMLVNERDLTAPLPHGMSGGAVWKLYPDKEDRKLAGIGIEYPDPSKHLIATRISVILEMIRHLVPETIGLISKPLDVDIDATGPRSAQGALKNARTMPVV